MIFSTDSAFKIETKDVSYLEGGIHEDVSLVGVRQERSANGNLFLEFAFDKNGAQLTHTEYEPTKRADQSTEDLEAKANNQVRRILQILQVWYTKEQLSSFSAESFDQFGKWVKGMLDAADKSKKVRLKVVYGNTGYTSLPKYAKYTFIESMEIPASESKVKDLKIDVFVRPEMGDTETATKSAAATFGAASNSPF